MAPAGEILAVRDEGTIWQILYQIEDDGLGVVNFDWRMFAQMYESESGRSFTEDYQAKTPIQDFFRGRRMHVEGEAFNQRLSPTERQAAIDDGPNVHLQARHRRIRPPNLGNVAVALLRTIRECEAVDCVHGTLRGEQNLAGTDARENSSLDCEWPSATVLSALDGQGLL